MVIFQTERNIFDQSFCHSYFKLESFVCKISNIQLCVNDTDESRGIKRPNLG